MKFSHWYQDLSRALVEAALDQGTVATVVQDLMRALEALQAAPSLILDLEERSTPLFTRRQALERAMDGDVHPYVIHALFLLQERSALSGLAEFIRAVETAARQLAGHFEVEVSSAQILAPEERTDLQSALEKYFQGSVHVRERLDQRLLGGFQVRIGDRCIDASTHGILKRLHESLLVS